MGIERHGSGTRGARTDNFKVDIVQEVRVFIRHGTLSSLGLEGDIGIQFVELVQGAGGRRDGILPFVQFQMACSNVGLEESELIVEIVWADISGLGIDVEGMVIVAMDIEGVCFGLVRVGLAQKLLWDGQSVSVLLLRSIVKDGGRNDCRLWMVGC